MNAPIKFTLKTLAIWIAFLVSQIVSGLIVGLLYQTPIPEAHDGPLNAVQAMLIVTALHALVMSLLASQMHGPWWRKALVLGSVYYVVNTALSMIEALYFNDFVKISPDLIVALSIGDLVKSVICAVISAWLWKSASQGHTPSSGLIWKFPLISGLYIVAYFAAGTFIAWQGEAVRAYYEQGQNINQLNLAVLQFGRGLIWAAMVWLLARYLKTTTPNRALLSGLAFAVFMGAGLLFPNPLMPWDVRKFHLVEIMASNMAFGVIASLIMMIGARKSATL